MNFLTPEYLETLKRQRLDLEPSTTLISALKQLKATNQTQKSQIKKLNQTIESLRTQNQYLSSCITKTTVDYQEYKSNRKNRQDRNTKNQVELIKKIEQLQFDNQKLLIQIQSYKAIAQISTSRSYLTTKTHIPQLNIQRPLITSHSITLIQPTRRQIQDLQISNQVLTKKILEASSQEAAGIRSQMKNNNKQIAKLKSSMNIK